MLRASLILSCLAVFALLAMALSLAVGSVSLSLGELWAALLGPRQGLAADLLWELRIPRTLTAFTVGAMLAVAGSLMQVLLRNPLADPYILGISGGAAVTALLAMALGLTAIPLAAIAFVGALIAVMLVVGLAHGSGVWSPTRVLLTGVVLSSGWAALISLILALSPNQGLRSMLFWLMGDLRDAGMPGWTAAVLLGATGVALTQARHLNLLVRGELQALALGVPTKFLYWLLFFLAALLTATAVSLAGSIGFIGLIVPHLVRLAISNDHRILLPAALLLGGTLLVLADTLARSLVSPQQLPVGVVTALIGVPLFLYTLNRNVRQPA